MAGDLSFWEKDIWEFALFCCAPASFCKPAYWTWQPIATDYKNHPVIRIRISKAKIAKPDARLIMIENKSPKQRFMSDHIGNILVCVITTHCFFLFVYFSAIMFIFFMWVELFLGLTFLHPDTIVKDFLFEIHTHIRDTYYARVGCCKGECWLLNIFYSFQHRVE
jgi:hypothetical protein